MRRVLSRVRILPIATVAAGLISACAKPVPTPPASPEPPFTAPQQMISGDLNVVARVDWRRATERDVVPTLFAWMKAVGISERMLAVMDACAAEVSSIWVAKRVTRAGVDDDAVIILGGRGDFSRTPGGGPCGLKGWKSPRVARGILLFEAETQEEGRSAPQLIARDPSGATAIATPAQADALLRIIEHGPDADRLEPPEGSLVAIDTRLGAGAIPTDLSGKVPLAANLGRGLERIQVQVEAPNPVQVRATLTYMAEADAKQAGELLKRFREVMLQDEQTAYRDAAQSSHAAVDGAVLRLTFEVGKVAEGAEGK